MLVILIIFSKKYNYWDYKGDADEDIDDDDYNIWKSIFFSQWHSSTKYGCIALLFAIFLYYSIRESSSKYVIFHFAYLCVHLPCISSWEFQK